MNKLKQVIVLRKDLNMRKGKMVAQGAHAAMKATIENLHRPEVKFWLAGAFTKVVVSVDSEQELFDLQASALREGLICSLIIDNGDTEFNGVKTPTAIAIGPALSEYIDKITGSLKLL